MKLTERLVGDHKTFRRMLQDLDALADQAPAARDLRRLIRTVELFKDHLLVHAWAEDEFYYPVIRASIHEAPPPVSAAYMDHLDAEHRTVDGYLDRLEAEVKSGAATWPQTYALFAKGLAAHMRKEEEELFPISERWLGAERLEAASQTLERRRSEAPRVRHHTPLKPAETGGPAAVPPTHGVSEKLLGTMELGPEIEGMEGRRLRMRLFTFEPGAVFGPLHDHKGRPGLVYILQGTITDHRNGTAKDYGPGIGWPEDAQTTHWLENRGSVQAVEISVDIVQSEPGKE